MASSFITKDNKHGFWIDDSVFQVVCRLLHDTIRDKFQEGEELWIEDFKVLLDNNAKGIFHSYMHLDLDNYFEEGIRQEKFNQILKRTEEKVIRYGEYIPLECLDSWYNDGTIDYYWKFPLETNRVIKVLTYLADVVNDRMKIAVSDEIDFDL